MTEESQKKRSDAHRKADKVYAEKHKPVYFTIAYKTDKEIGEKLKQYLEDTDQNPNNYIKGLIAADLKEKGII